jgi:hypothetical protein
MNIAKLFFSIISAGILTMGCKSQTTIKENKQETVKTEVAQDLDKPKHKTRINGYIKAA